MSKLADLRHDYELMVAELRQLRRMPYFEESRKKQLRLRIALVEELARPVSLSKNE